MKLEVTIIGIINLSVWRRTGCNFSRAFRYGVKYDVSARS